MATEAQRNLEMELVVTFRRLSRQDKEDILALAHERAAAQARRARSKNV